jgi:glycerol-3-phosphate dehydrogenase (NAD(P)+)
MTSACTHDVTIIGGGSFGTALATILGRLGRRVMLSVRRAEAADKLNSSHTNEEYAPGQVLPETITATVSMEEAVKASPAVLMAVPSRSFRETARLVGEHLSGDQILVHATKGIEIDTYKRMSEILREETCALKIGVISGPTLAAELMAGHPAGALIASRFDEVVAAVQALFERSNLRMYGGRDVVGTELAGAFKNIIAIAAGCTDGLGFGDNARSLLVTRGLSEMARLGVMMGADVFTFGGLAGIGDLMATCSSKLSRNHTVGERLAKGEAIEAILDSMHHVAEGVPTTAAVNRHILSIGLDLPIVRAVHGTLYEHRPPLSGLTELMALPVGSELASLRYR